MRLIIEMSLNPEGIPFATSDIVWSLRDYCDRQERGEHTAVLRDINGNTIGNVKVVPSE